MDEEKEYNEYWDERAAEQVRFGAPIHNEKTKEYNRSHPIPSREELLTIIRETQSN